MKAITFDEAENALSPARPVHLGGHRDRAAGQPEAYRVLVTGQPGNSPSSRVDSAARRRAEADTVHAEHKRRTVAQFSPDGRWIALASTETTPAPSEWVKGTAWTVSVFDQAAAQANSKSRWLRAPANPKSTRSIESGSWGAVFLQSRFEPQGARGRR
jgi:hypothetical protein